jgi:phosphatidylglycerol:prolipoprotein diacylglycerol transferase
VAPRINAYLGEHLHGLAVPGFYGMVGLGLVLAALLFRVRASKANLSPLALRALAESFPLAMLGSAMLPALFTLPEGFQSPQQFFANGLVSYAGYLSGMAALLWRVKHHRLPLGQVLDALAPALGVGIALGRWGCFFAGCDFGSPTLMPWGVRFPAGSQAFDTQVATGQIGAYQLLTLPVHPTQLYESALGVVVACVSGFGPDGVRPGSRFARAAAVYALGRSLIELFRGDANRGIVLGISTAQWISLGVLALVVAWHWQSRTLRLKEETA